MPRQSEVEKLKQKVEKLELELVVWKQERFNLYQRLGLGNRMRTETAKEILDEFQDVLFDYDLAVKEEAIPRVRDRIEYIKSFYGIEEHDGTQI